MVSRTGVVLVTGATGFLGSHLLRALLGAGSEVHALVRPHARLDRWRGIEHKIVQWTGDVTDVETLTECCRRAQPEIIFHMAGDPSSRRFRGDWKVIDHALSVHFTGTLNMIRAAVLSGAPVRTFIRTGSLEEYGVGPTPYKEGQREQSRSPYTASQVATTHFCQMLQPQVPFPLVTLRPALVYGPAQSMDFLIPSLIDALLRGRRFVTTSGEQVRDLLYVDDVIAALCAAAEADDLGGKIINICSGCECRVRDIVTFIADAMNARDLLDLGAAPPREGDLVRVQGNAGQAEHLLGWRPVVSLNDGLRRTIEWHRGQHSQG